MGLFEIIIHFLFNKALLVCKIDNATLLAKQFLFNMAITQSFIIIWGI